MKSSLCSNCRILSSKEFYTHFACADHKDKTHARQQFAAFRDLLKRLYRSVSFRAPIQHAANSAAIIDMPETHLDMVRAGISLYGLFPSRDVNQEKIGLRPRDETEIQYHPPETGCQRIFGQLRRDLESPRKIPPLQPFPSGTPMGTTVLLSSTGYMMVQGKKAPIAGRVCMDLTMLDVGDIPEAKVNDEVIVFGGQDSNGVTVDEIAETLGTINYEVVSTISSRVPRVFLR